MNEQDLWGLAENASVIISNMVACWIREPRRPDQTLSVLGGLMTRLYLIHVALRKPRLDQRATLQRRLERILRVMETLCTWHMTIIERSKRYGHLPTPFGTLSSLTAPLELISSKSETHQQIQESVLSFAPERPKLVAQYFKKLDGFSQPKDDGAHHSSLERRSEQLNMADDIPREVHQKLYNALKKYSTCPFSPSNTPHWGRLRLKDKFQTHENEVLFDTVFAEAPPVSTAEGLRWQQLQFRVSRKIPRKKATGVAWNDCVNSIAESEPIAEAAKEIKLEHFCQILGTQYGRIRMRLRVLEERLLELPGPEMADYRILPASSLPLAHVLELRELKSTGKLILAFVLAKSFWQFYDSDWMNMPWSSESIHFMREQAFVDGTTGQLQISPSDPYLAFHFADSARNKSFEYFNSHRVIFDYPRILALGVLLVEICGGRLAKQVGLEHNSLEQQINDDYADCWDTVHKNPYWPDLKFQNETAIDTYREATKVCLSKDILQQTVNIYERRNILFKRVVRPLGKLLEDIGLVDQSGMVKRIETQGLRSSMSTNPNQAGPSFLAANPNSCHVELWMKSIIDSRLAREIFMFTKTGSYPRVKIAILDTGYDPESPFFCNRSRKGRIKDWKDFASDSSEPQDKDGHGTHVLSLAMKVAPSADIYVARVCDATGNLQHASKNVADAITWAVNVCQVDIISISFGYPEEIEVKGEPLVSRAIAQAFLQRDRRIILFAAGGNLGGNQKEMFPANHELVIPIRSTDHEGVFQGFNPPPNDSGLNVFGTLGKDVSSAWLHTHGGEKIQTGTSVATPIAAGIASMILADSRIMLKKDLSEMNNELVKRLETRAGMRSMFQHLSGKTNWNHFYIYPQEFMRRNPEERHEIIRGASRKT